ncbi:hypothetical protein BU24DRAFT_452071 [Aaosphaeria arxii CBS 175.79]|uniref:Uncharacterized protein n=1 Tax=Aaosphaeria arxii CBS 175.79 TaxID=1450172 RepID=A0A6A5XJ07_9PLEO|nr:uncharacterized protein BU24DRAFT_452071 [Aaosphaeria arxii CBS 175.79]KAF2013112.1 hypothetical protein BU24DRAFT_452071 [Aaosphaeria arxii CBS 175.79]
MSLCAQYQAFLANPSVGALHDGNASLHYVTTLTSINDAPAVIKHLAVQEKLLKKKSEKVLNSIEAPNALSLEVETTIEFVAGGGAYLPGLDDNFVADRTVTFPVIHLVHFDRNKISQIRLHWDQGSLLKQIEVIGARARNWPIRDGKDQIRLITRSAGLVAQSSGNTSSQRTTTSQDSDPASARPTSSASSVSNAMNDPHATLSLFQSRDPTDEGSRSSHPIAPRMQSAKPPPREYSELFVNEDGGSPSPANAASQREVVPVKSGSGKNFKPNRLFDEHEDPSATPMSVKTNAKKYDHFDFADEEDQATPRGAENNRPSIKSKHQSQWGFEDFVTPNKTKPKVLGQAVRHFGWSDDEEESSPVRRPVVHRARPDADPHFEFVDDGTPEAAKKQPSTKGNLHNKGLGLYKDHVIGSDDEADDDGPRGDTARPLGDITTVVKNENRKKDFGSQWEMADESPAQVQKAFVGSKATGKTQKSLDTHWGLYEQSPEQSKKENSNAHGIKTSGNGMGGRKGTSRAWAIGDEGGEDEQQQSTTKAPASQSKGFWDF